MNELVNGGDHGNNIQVAYLRGDANQALEVPSIRATRYAAGYGQEKGRLVTKIFNRASKSIPVVLFDVLPWYLRVYFHTLVVTNSNGNTVEPLRKEFSLGVDRVRPYSMELVLSLPPKSTTTVEIAFEKSILKWLEYPPDANHGFYVAPAVVSYPCDADKCLQQCLDEDSPRRNRVFTEAVLMNLPTPDFSMPYNVICLACTVVALAFGPLHNITTKSLIIDTEGEPPSMLKRVWGKVRDKLPFGRRPAVAESGPATPANKSDSDPAQAQ